MGLATASKRCVKPCSRRSSAHLGLRACANRYREFRELVLMCVVYNIKRVVTR
jgi:hypothetical protein